MKILVYILLLLSSNVIGQFQFSSCPIDSDSKVALHFELHMSGKDDSTFYSRSYVTNAELGKDCEYFNFDSETYEVSSAHGGKLFICSPDQIVKLNISASNLMLPAYRFDLDSYEILTSLSLPALAEINIKKR